MMNLNQKFVKSAGICSIAMLLASIAVLGQAGNYKTVSADEGQDIGQAATEECNNLPISSVKAMGNDGNVPSNTLDNNLQTRWSYLAYGAWIQADLGASKSLCGLDIAWYKGNERASNFVVFVSTDGSTYTSILSTKSSGNSLSSEKYVLPSVSARYVKLVINGNTQNNWASITEIDVFGKDSTSVIDPIPPAGNDKFGIKKLYASKSGGEEWFMNMNTPTQDTRFDPQTALVKNSDGSFKVKSDKVRMNVFTSTGYDPSKITTYNQIELAKKGYMQASNDWKNIEITGVVKVNAYSGDDNFAWYARGGKHSDTECEGTAYKGDVYYSGKTRFAKEQWHVSYAFTPTKQATDSIKGKWVGIKTVIYNFEQNGKTVVKMENWIDYTNTGNWVKITEKIDNGGWGTDGGHCGGTADQIMTWGGPITTFRWDSATDVDIKNFSVREIVAP